MTLLHGDALTMLKTLPDESVNCCVTSPPYWGLRDYGVDGQLGLERTPEEYASKMVEVFREVKRVLKKEGTLWLNLGDSYNGSGKGPGGTSSKLGNVLQSQEMNCLSNAPGLKPKDLVGIPWRVAFALQADGWHLRQDIIWHKPNPMPESVTDRCTKAHEYMFLLSKSARYYYDNEAIKERQAESSAERALYGWNGRNDDGSNGARTGAGIRKMKESGMSMGEAGLIPLDGMRNKRSVWTVTTKPFKEAHFATFPPDLIEPCILAGCPEGGTVLDPFFGSGTTGLVCSRLNRQYIGIELNGEYIEMARRRIEGDAPLLNVGVLPL
jgi:DNA modification methylase